MAATALPVSPLDPFSLNGAAVGVKHAAAAAAHFHTASAPVDSSDVVAKDSPPPRLVNDLLLRRVREDPDSPFFGYPATPRGKDDYVYHSVGDVDRYADAAARLYLRAGVVPEHPGLHAAEVVALLAPSNVDYVVATFALSRLGFAVLFLSNRLATEAVVALLRQTECTKLIVSPQYAAAAAAAQEEANKQQDELKQNKPLSVFSIVDYAQYAAPTPALTRGDDRALVEAAFPTSPGGDSAAAAAAAATRIAFIIHSSGSTGLPKPIFQTHAACLANYASGVAYRAFITLPLFHNHGLSTLFRALCAGKAAALYNASLPLAGSTLVASMRAVAPESLHCVPYALKLMAEDPRGVDTLRPLRLVLYAGSSCPDELGDRLVAAGVYLAGHYGATEMGQLMTSLRDDPAADRAWAYMRPSPATKPFLRMVPRDGGGPDNNTYELVVLDGLPSKVVSNSDDPPNSFYTRDLFAPHPTLPDAWKYLGRVDDRVTLVNGEKVLPVPYEHQVRQHALVRECVVFGVGRAVPGLVVIPSDGAAALSQDELLDALMPTIAATNARTEAFGRVSREMVAVFASDAAYPRTDKGTVIRAAFYRQFAAEIDAVYARFEAASAGADEKPLLLLSAAELETYLLDLFVGKLGVDGSILRAETDLFEAGVDSLQAITARAQILREVDLGGQKPAHNVVFEFPSVRQLARHLVALRSGEGDSDGSASAADEIQAMRDLIAKYSDFSAYAGGAGADKSARGVRRPGPETVLLTGATGSLGAHLLDQLARAPHVARVYCLVRAASREAAADRVRATLVAKGLAEASLTDSDKVVCLPADLSRASLGLEDSVLAELRARLTTVVHAAWAVNFNLGVRSFEAHHIRGTYNLLNVCLAAGASALPATPASDVPAAGIAVAPAARLFFCSSISAGAGTPIPGTVAETFIADLAHAQAMGYARAKVVAEHIVGAAAAQTGMAARVLRLGQIVGDADRGIWNTTEAIPLLVRSALTTGALPALDEEPSWLPVDLMARAVIELAGLTGEDDPSAVSPSPSPPSSGPAAVATSSSSPPAAIAASSSTVYQVQNHRLFSWTADLLPALRDAGLDFQTVPQREWVARLRASDPDPRRNPAIKLLDFFADKYDNDRPGRAGLVFETRRTAAASAAVRDGFDVVGSGLVAKMVAWWRTEWAEGESGEADK